MATWMGAASANAKAQDRLLKETATRFEWISRALLMTTDNPQEVRMATMEAPAGELTKPVLAFIHIRSLVFPILDQEVRINSPSCLSCLLRGQLAGLRSSTSGQHASTRTHLTKHGSAVKPQKPSRPEHAPSLSQHPKPGAMD